MAGEPIIIARTPARITGWLVAILALLLAAHGMGLVMTYAFDHDQVFGLVPLFNVGVEGNVPTFFSSALFMMAAGLFWLLWRLGAATAGERRTWLLLALVFAFLAVDEFAVIHEKLILPLRQGFGTSGLLHFAWVIPYSVAVLLLALTAGPTLWRLGPRFRLLFGLAAGTFLSGAIGVEMLGGRYYETIDRVDLRYRLFQTAEEFLEFSGLILLVFTLLSLVRERSAVATIQLDLRPQAARLPRPVRRPRAGIDTA